VAEVQWSKGKRKSTEHRSGNREEGRFAQGTSYTTREKQECGQTQKIQGDEEKDNISIVTACPGRVVWAGRGRKGGGNKKDLGGATRDKML